ncbi:hypothetical protein ACIQVK_53415 [Streptomyces sp. NPDC090493]|uniref:hypothetical protein n=1 Tax=Streptomyces sp. NPDC090493 TaxID=3365964 RepID=UPI00381642AC
MNPFSLPREIDTEGLLMKRVSSGHIRRSLRTVLLLAPVLLGITVATTPDIAESAMSYTAVICGPYRYQTACGDVHMMSAEAVSHAVGSERGPVVARWGATAKKPYGAAARVTSAVLDDSEQVASATGWSGGRRTSTCFRVRLTDDTSVTEVPSELTTMHLGNEPDLIV